MKKLYIIKAGTTFPSVRRRFGDFDQWTRSILDKTDVDVVVIDAEHGESLPLPSDCAGVVMTGSHAMVTDKESWSIRLEQWIPSLIDADVPYFGICYGHQLLASAMGGTVCLHPIGDEIGTADIHLLDSAGCDPVFRSMPKHFLANVFHSQTVLALPEGAVCLAKNSHEPHQAFRLGTCAWGVQFHPEFTLPLMRAYILENECDLKDKGLNVSSVSDELEHTPTAPLILKKFVSYVQSRKAL